MKAISLFLVLVAVILPAAAQDPPADDFTW